MRKTDLIAATAPEAAHVTDRHYPKVLAGMIQRAHTRVWASVFAVDLDPEADSNHLVLEILNELAAARWRGVDARLIVSGSRDNLIMAEVAATAVSVSRQMGIPTKWLCARNRRGSHAKYVIADDEVLLGSHNWSPSAFLRSTQDSVWQKSEPLAAYLCALFASQWTRPMERSRE